MKTLKGIPLTGFVRLSIDGKPVGGNNFISQEILNFLATTMVGAGSSNYQLRDDFLFDQGNLTPQDDPDKKDGMVYQLIDSFYTIVTTPATPVNTYARAWEGSVTIPGEDPVELTSIMLGHGLHTNLNEHPFTLLYARLSEDDGENPFEFPITVAGGALVEVLWELYFDLPS